MKLLLENWQRYLNESEEKYFPWLEELKKTDIIREQRKFLNDDDRFITVGSGSFRIVYRPVEDPDYVIKLIWGEYPRDERRMNKDDFELSIKYPLIFPKAYAHANNFNWIVMEAVTPLTDWKNMWLVLEKSFPKEVEAIDKAYWEYEQLSPAERRGTYSPTPPYMNIDDPFSLFDAIMRSFQGRSDRSQGHLSLGGREDMLQKILVPSERGWFPKEPVIGPVYQELSKVMHAYRISRGEISLGNIGYDKDSNFKILDSSVF
jgi:hypothetical protein